ncbi:MAG TPA: metal ABC transporter substrate-binding protein [Abditibacteriaceae bacterium]
MMKMRMNTLTGFVAALSLTALAAPSRAEIKVVATLPELACITEAVGGKEVSVYAIAKPNRDYHTIEPRPSDVSRTAGAKLLVRTGMGLDSWMNALANATGDRKLMAGGSAVVDCSAGVRRIDVPTQSLSGASGDVHVDGNPHFFYDPIYGKFAARNILRGLIRVDGGNAAYYRRNYVMFNAEIDRRMAGWKRDLAPFAGRPVVTYHENYAYFIKRFGLREYGHLEPKPGLPPSAGHINSLIGNMKRDGVKAVVIESIYPTRYADFMKRQAGIKYVVAPYSAGSISGVGYINFIDRLVDSFRKALD